MRTIRLLLWLKWKLMWRGYRRSASALFGAIVMLMLFTPFALGIAFLCGLGFLHIPLPYNAHLLRGVLLGIYLFWLLAPLMGYALNESYDITRLFVYPLSVRQIFTGAICGSLLDLPTLLLLPTLLAVLIGFGHDGVTFLFTLFAVTLFLFHTLSLSQALLLVSAGFLRSRRFRDAFAILVPVFFILYYVATQMLARSAMTDRMSHLDWKGFLNGRFWDVINYLPSGLAARAIGAAQLQSVGMGLVSLTALAVVTVGTVYLASWLLQKVYLGEVLSPQVRSSSTVNDTVAASSSPAPAATRAAPRSAFGRRLPPVVQAMVDKEIRYLFRDPYFKMVLMNLVYMLVVGVFVFLNPMGQRGPHIPGAGAIWGTTGFLLLMEMQLACNIFGTEGGAATTLFSFSCSRRQIMLGKNLTLFGALSVVNLIFLLILAALASALARFGLLFCWMELSLVVTLALGNLASIYFPLRIVMRGWRVRQMSATRGCSYGLVYMAMLLVTLVLLLPVLAALLAPTLEWIAPAWLAVTLPLALAYTVGLYALSLHLAEPLLLQREQEIIAKVSQQDD